jgi:hypothetical protein
MKKCIKTKRAKTDEDMSCLKIIICSAVIALPLLLLGLLFASCVPDYFTNNRQLHQIENALTAIPIPPQTQRLVTRSAVGLLVGNGNHCDFFAGTVFRSSSPPDLVRQHYAGRTFLNPVTGKKEQVDAMIVSNVEAWNSQSLPASYESLQGWDLSPQKLSEGTVFLVSIMRSYKANNDCRCH